jgi:hypothetical protein
MPIDLRVTCAALPAPAHVDSQGSNSALGQTLRQLDETAAGKRPDPAGWHSVPYTRAESLRNQTSDSEALITVGDP